MPKRKADNSLDALLARPWCYYCERDFDSDRNLVDHQRATHFMCQHDNCGRRLNTVGGLKVHMQQVHKMELTEVPRAHDHRKNDTNIEIFCMEGIPDEVQATRTDAVIKGYRDHEVKHRMETGNPLPGSGEQPNKRQKTTETKEELKARVAAHKKKRAEEKAAMEAGLPVDEATATSTPPATSSPAPPADAPSAFGIPFPGNMAQPPPPRGMAPAPGMLQAPGMMPTPGLTPPPGMQFPLPTPMQHPLPTPMQFPLPTPMQHSLPTSMAGDGGRLPRGASFGNYGAAPQQFPPTYQQHGLPPLPSRAAFPQPLPPRPETLALKDPVMEHMFPRKYKPYNYHHPGKPVSKRRRADSFFEDDNISAKPAASTDARDMVDAIFDANGQVPVGYRPTNVEIVAAKPVDEPKQPKPVSPKPAPTKVQKSAPAKGDRQLLTDNKISWEEKRARNSRYETKPKHSNSVALIQKAIAQETVAPGLVDAFSRSSAEHQPIALQTLSQALEDAAQGQPAARETFAQTLGGAALAS